MCCCVLVCHAQKTNKQTKCFCVYIHRRARAHKLLTVRRRECKFRKLSNLRSAFLSSGKNVFDQPLEHGEERCKVETADLVRLQRGWASHLSKCCDDVFSKLDFLSCVVWHVVSDGLHHLRLLWCGMVHTQCHFFVKVQIHVHFDAAASDTPRKASQHLVEGRQSRDARSEVTSSHKHLCDSDRRVEA
jgi:hypothetical protein